MPQKIIVLISIILMIASFVYAIIAGIIHQKENKDKIREFKSFNCSIDDRFLDKMRLQFGDPVEVIKYEEQPFVKFEDLSIANNGYVAVWKINTPEGKKMLLIASYDKAKRNCWFYSLR